MNDDADMQDEWEEDMNDDADMQDDWEENINDDADMQDEWEEDEEVVGRAEKEREARIKLTAKVSPG